MKGPIARERCGSDIGPNSRLVIMILVAATAIQHLGHASVSLLEDTGVSKVVTYSKDLENIAIRLIPAKFVPRPIEAEDESLGSAIRTYHRFHPGIVDIVVASLEISN